MKPNWITNAAQHALGVREVRIVYGSATIHDGSVERFLWSLPECLNGFKNLTTVEFAIYLLPSHERLDILEKKFAAALVYVDRHVGVKARYETKLEGHSDCAHLVLSYQVLVWSWKTNKENAMD